MASIFALFSCKQVTIPLHSNSIEIEEGKTAIATNVMIRKALFNSDSKDDFINLFSPIPKSRTANFDSKVDQLFDLLVGEFKEMKGGHEFFNNSQNKEGCNVSFMKADFGVSTDTYDYFFEYQWGVKDEIQKENEGLWSLYVMRLTLGKTPVDLSHIMVTHYEYGINFREEMTKDEK